jgi:Holliday junction DNA helicase RuvA
VQNVGARVALSVLSTLSPRDLQRALALSDKAMIGRAPGVGPKLALRIATELKDKAPAMMLRGDDGAHIPAAAPRGPAADAVAALLKLGYSEGQAAEAVARAGNDLGDEAEAGALIREALRGMGR